MKEQTELDSVFSEKHERAAQLSDFRNLCCQLTPLRQRDRAVLFECDAGIQMTVEIEAVVDRGMNGSEFLQGS